MDIFAQIETWWGGLLDQDVVRRMTEAPEEHLREFLAFVRTVTTSQPISLPEITGNVLRPAIGSSYASLDEELSRSGRAWGPAGLGYRKPRSLYNLERANQLLLYAHEVVVDVSLIEVLDWMFKPDDFEDWPEPPPYKRFDGHDRRIWWRQFLERLQALRPLIDSGIVFLNPDPTVFADKSGVLDPVLTPEWADLAREAFNELIFPPRPKDFEVGTDEMYMAWEYRIGHLLKYLEIAKGNRAHILLESDRDKSVMGTLMQPQAAVRRVELLRNVAQMRIPRIEAGTREVVNLRLHDSAFVEWRQHLGNVLAVVNDTQIDGSQDRMRRIVAGELKEGLAKVYSRAKRSPALDAMLGGVRGFAVTGVSASAAGAMTGNPWVAAVTGSAGKSLDAGLSYLQAKIQRRKDKLVLDVMLALES